MYSESLRNERRRCRGCAGNLMANAAGGGSLLPTGRQEASSSGRTLGLACVIGVELGAAHDRRDMLTLCCHGREGTRTHTQFIQHVPV